MYMSSSSVSSSSKVESKMLLSRIAYPKSRCCEGLFPVENEELREPRPRAGLRNREEDREVGHGAPAPMLEATFGEPMKPCCEECGGCEAARSR